MPKTPARKQAPRRRRSDFEGRYVPATGESTHPRDMDTLRRNIPCQWACPATTDVPGYIRAVAEKEYARAYIINRRSNLFPGILGRICSRPCEEACRHGESDLGEPVAICHLKRLAADQTPVDYPVREEMFASTGKTVGIVGGGPAGLAAAHSMALFGHRVTLYEALPKLGGMLLYGIPDFRVPPDLVQKEIETVLRQGVQVEMNCRLGRDVSLDELTGRHDALIIALGCYEENRLGVPGEDLDGFYTGLDFMMRVNQGERPAVGRRAAVIGGGFTAMDCARAALRLGARQITIYIRKTEEDLQVTREEIVETKREGIAVTGLVSTLEVRGDKGVRGLRLVRNRISADRSAGKKAVPIEGSEFEVEADTVIAAVGQRPATDLFASLALDPAGIERSTGVTKRPGLFLAGDFLAGASTVIGAIGHARNVAVACDRYLMGRIRRERVAVSESAEDTDRERDWDFLPRVPMPAVEQYERLSDLEREVETGYSVDGGAEEAKRCYLCDLRYKIHVPDCIYCRYCIDVCPRDCIHLAADVASGASEPHERIRRTRKWNDVAGIVIDSDRCIRCGECLRVCPTQCIHVTHVRLAERLVADPGALS